MRVLGRAEDIEPVGARSVELAIQHGGAHVERVLAKLGVASRTEAAVRAVTEGLKIRHMTD